MDINTFDKASFNNVVKQLAESFEPTESQKEELKSATREQVLAAIANVAVIPSVPAVIISCMAQSADACFKNGSFDYDEWKKKVEQCTSKLEYDNLPAEPIFETRAILLALAVGYGVGMTVAFMLK